MTEQEKLLRENSQMRAFTFYIDDLTKLKTIRKLKDLGLDTEKGSISATIRVLLTCFAENKFDSLIDDIQNSVINEYILTTKKNKRSSL